MKCPITDNELKYIGHEPFCMDPDSYYESRTLKHTYKFARHPFSWTLFRLIEIDGKKCDTRYFRLKEDDTWQEEMSVDGIDQLIPINSSNWTIFKLRLSKKLSRLKRKLQDFWRYSILRKKRVQFPKIRSVEAKTIAQDLVSVKPMTAPSGKVFTMDLKKQQEVDVEQELIDATQKPNLSKEDTDLAEYIKGKLRVVTEVNLEKERKTFKNEDIQVGDEIFAWDMGGWNALAGRAGEIVVRNRDKFVTARLTMMS